jgi:hypothetical protein
MRTENGPEDRNSSSWRFQELGNGRSLETEGGLVAPLPNELERPTRRCEEAKVCGAAGTPLLFWWSMDADWPELSRSNLFMLSTVCKDDQLRKIPSSNFPRLQRIPFVPETESNKYSSAVSCRTTRKSSVLATTKGGYWMTILIFQPLSWNKKMVSCSREIAQTEDASCSQAGDALHREKRHWSRSRRGTSWTLSFIFYHHHIWKVLSEGSTVGCVCWIVPNEGQVASTTTLSPCFTIIAQQLHLQLDYLPAAAWEFHNDDCSMYVLGGQSNTSWWKLWWFKGHE